jgi:hypothetical protein
MWISIHRSDSGAPVLGLVAHDTSSGSYSSMVVRETPLSFNDLSREC